MRPSFPLFAIIALAGCKAAQPRSGVDCTQDGRCPEGLRCFPDWRCYEPSATPECEPPCWGEVPLCDHATLRCVACLADADCSAGEVCVPPVMRCRPGCSAAHPMCTGEGERCDVDLGACHGCLDDAECADPKQPRCDVATGTCQPCVPDRDDCRAGQYCSAAGGVFACAPGCKSQRDCGGGSPECCGHKCVDLASDGNNCGGCGVACRGGRTCCGGLCTDLAADADNCGACGLSCARPNVAGVACKASKCSDLGCESYFADCNQNAADGCEINLTRDPANCYKCGNACPAPPHATPGCTVAGCGLLACLAGWANCNGFEGDGCEYATAGFSGDRVNCGACGKACGAMENCVNGKCQ